MRAIRKDYFLDHDHSAYVDQWDWEKTINAEDRTLDTLTDTVERIWKVLLTADDPVCPDECGWVGKAAPLLECAKKVAAM